MSKGTKRAYCTNIYCEKRTSLITLPLCEWKILTALYIHPTYMYTANIWMVDFVDFLYEKSVFLYWDFSHWKSINIYHHNICSEASRLRDFEMKIRKTSQEQLFYNPMAKSMLHIAKNQTCFWHHFLWQKKNPQGCKISLFCDQFENLDHSNTVVSCVSFLIILLPDFLQPNGHRALASHP